MDLTDISDPLSVIVVYRIGYDLCVSVSVCMSVYVMCMRVCVFVLQ